MATSDTKMTTDMELAEEIERRLGELEITINKATNFQAFGDQFNERLWSTWQQAQVEEERCRKEFRLLTKVIAALRRGPEREGFYEKLWKDFVSLQRGDAQGIIAKVEAYYRERPPSGEMLVIAAMDAVGEWKTISDTACPNFERAMEELARVLSAAEAEGRKG